ncbi:MAG: glycosyltransferase family 39 protein [Candidatus Polarisedimenticolia bacterium]
MTRTPTSSSKTRPPHAAGTLRAPLRARHAALIVFTVAILWRAVYLVGIAGTACLDINLDPISDMEAFHRWALSLAQGDWLDRGGFHPWHPWQEAVAPRSQWDAWYGRSFHQEPFYPYSIALAYLVGPRQPFTMILVQAVLGAAGCAAVCLLARRVAGPGPGLTAGLLAAVYGPFLYYESLMLRDALMIPLHAFMLWAIVEARARRGGRRAAVWWGVAGALLGVSFVTKASILPFVVVAAALAVADGRRQPGSGPRAAAVAALMAGFVALLIPPMARNAVVGAPLLQLTTRGPIEFINGNNPWHPGIGWFDGDDARVSAYARQTLAQAEGRLGPTIARVLGDWKGRPLDLAGLQLRKLGYFFAPFEMPNNASYGWFRLNSAVLRYATLSFLWLSPLAALGLLTTAPRRAALLPVYAFLVLGVATTVAFYVIARFRAPLMPAILVFAGSGAWWLWERLRGLEFGRLSAGLALVVVLLGVNASVNYPDDAFVRPQDHLIAIQGYRQRGDLPRALEEAKQGRSRFPEFPQFWREAGMIEMELGRPAEALASLKEALSRNPRDEAVRQAVERLQGRFAPDILPPR